MDTPSGVLGRRTRLIPRSPKRSARASTPTGENPEVVGNHGHGTAFVANRLAGGTGEDGTLILNADSVEGVSGSTPGSISRQPASEERAADPSPFSRTSENFARSKSENVLHDTEAPETPVESAATDVVSPVSPPPSVDSADVALPNVEVSDEPTDNHRPVAASDTTDSESDRTSVPKSTEPATPSDCEVESSPSLTHGLAELGLSSPTPERPLLTPASEDLLAPLGQTSNPVTVRDLLNATPRPSPGPDSLDASESRDSSESAESGSGQADPEATDGGTDKILDLHENTSLDVTSDDFDDEVSDFLAGLDGLQIADDYDAQGVEPLPASPFSKPEFQNSLKRGISLAKTLLACIDNCELAAKEETQLHRLRQTASRLSAFDYPAKRRIGIVGDSGAGKSSLINSLLHLDLAHRGDQGSAVTSFVTEYRNRKADQKAPFTIKVKCADRSHLKDQMDDFVYDIRILNDPSTLDSASEAEFCLLERRSAVALSTLESIFPDREESTEAFLTDKVDGSVERITARLQELTDEIEFPEGAETGAWVETANSASECRQQIMRFMENGFWPLINKVKVYMSAQVLKTGIILADLPGFRDINLARVRKAEAYQHKCDEIFIVANIKRVVSDRSVGDLMTGEFSNPKPNTTVSIICTHADEINLAEWMANRKLRSLVDQKKLRSIAQGIISAKKKNQADRLEIARMEHKYLFVALRNQRIESQVLTKYASLATGSASLRVFCVGNKDYDDRQLCEKARALAIQGSGVPELRDFCHSVVAKAQFRATLHFLQTQVPDLIQSLKLWIEAANDDVGPAVPSNVLPDLQDRLLDYVNSFSSGVERQLKTAVFEKFKRGQRSYDQCAIDAGREWTTWHHTTFQAFMRQNGTHYTRAAASRQMNVELMRKMNNDLSDAWTASLERFEQTVSLLQENLEDQLVKMRHMMRELKAPQTLQNSIKLKQHDLKYRLQEEQNKFLAACRDIQYNASGDHHTSYILTTMLPTYRACAMESGPGMKARMYNTMERKLDRRDIFAFIYNQIDREMNRIFNETTDTITAIVSETCADVEQQVQLIRGPESEASSVGTTHLEQISSTLRQAMEEVQNLRVQAAPARREAVQWGWTD